MANIWKSKVLPKISSVFGAGKKKAAAEAVKSFDESKEEISKEFEEKKTELEPKVKEIYEASPPAIKELLKKPTESGVTKKNSSAVKKFLEELAKIESPGAKTVSEAAAKFGAVSVAGPITFIFEKVSTLIPAEEPPAPAEPAATAESTSKELTAEAVEEIKKEEAEKVEETPPPPPPPPAEAEAEAPAPAAEPAPEPEPEPAKA